MNNLLAKLKLGWGYVQDLIDVKGGTILAVMSSVFIARVAMSAFGHPALTPSEAAVYGSAMGALAVTNR
jgi:hypothetical protein